jgi:predicted AlkP superfamily pyrophosphatase or phosphodiesterase
MKNLILFCAFFSAIQLAYTQKKQPKLMVGIVVDQMCYDYLYRFESKFSEHGFKKIMNQGTICHNAHYNYVPTFTGPGHASIYTGTTPSNHGIVANDWYERETGKVINCVDDESVTALGTNSTDGLCSPHYLKTTTITDQLKLTYPHAKVISMSIKDRGAILPGGHLSDGSYWYDYASGKFITSTYFKSVLPQWVSDFNAEGQVDTYMTKTWNTLLDIQAYTESSSDDSPYEQILSGKERPTFPYDLAMLGTKTPKYQLFTITPFANTYLTDFAIRAIEAENMGRGEQTDFLCISFSTPDIVGHSFGPYSIEMEDVYIRLDLEIAKLLKHLEAQVGKDGFTLFVTADHAVVPVPQLLVDKKLPGGYVFMNEKLASLKAALKKAFGADLIRDHENSNIYLNHQLLDSLHISRDNVEEFVAEKISQWEGVKAVYTEKQLKDGCSDDEWRDMVRRGYHAAESGDVLFLLEPGYLPKADDVETAHKGTSHGSAFNYDTHVPLLWYGKGIPIQSVYRKLNITDIAATLTHLLFLQRSGAMTGDPILEILPTK